MDNNSRLDILLRLSEMGAERSKAVCEAPDADKLINFSCHRGNIIQWYPFKKGSAVLELCAQCGAVTQGIVGKGVDVTAVTDSPEKAQIIKNRFQTAQNLSVKVGDWRELLKSNTEKYSYIVYTGGALSVEDLSEIKAALTESGKLLIATENRNGLKYFAGCKDAYTGSLYSGVEGYGHGAKLSYDMPEWKRALNKAGFEEVTFRYPYPDYSFCEHIFSDALLPQKNQLYKNDLDFKDGRVYTFDENAAFNTAMEYGIFPLVSNSYFIECGKPCDIIYTKFSKERNPGLRAYTCVTEKDGSYGIVKYPDTPESAEHIRDMYEYKTRLEEIFADDEFHISDCMLNGDGASFEYIDGETLSSKIEGHIANGDFEALKGDIDILNKVASKIQSEESFVPDSEFTGFFGNVGLPDGLTASSYALVDLIGENIILNDKINLIDYEWVLPFKVPVEYIKFRTLFFSAGISGLPQEKKTEIYALAGVDYNLFEKFYGMELSFQRSVCDDSLKLRNILGKIGSTKYSLKNLSVESSAYQTKVYNAEKQLMAAKMQYSPYADISVETGGSTDRVIFEPAQGGTFMSVPQITAYKDGREFSVTDFTHNAGCIAPEGLCFTSSPEFVINCEGFERLQIKYNVYLFNSDLIQLLVNLYKKDETIAELQRQIEELLKQYEEQEKRFKEHIENNVINRAAIKKMFGKKGEE